MEVGNWKWFLLPDSPNYIITSDYSKSLGHCCPAIPSHCQNNQSDITGPSQCSIVARDQIITEMN